MKYFKTGLALAVSTMLSGNALADSHAAGPRSDIYGDRLINLPMDESTVTSSSVEIQFLHILALQQHWFDGYSESESS